jgi:hypothetical protein
MKKTPINWLEYYGTNRAEERFVDEAAPPQFSGLLDANGQPLYRLKNPIGFQTDPSRKFK